MVVWKRAKSQEFVKKPRESDREEIVFPYKSFLFLTSMKFPLKGYKPQNLRVNAFVNILFICDNIIHTKN